MGHWELQSTPLNKTEILSQISKAFTALFSLLNQCSFIFVKLHTNTSLLFGTFLPLKNCDTWLARACKGTVWKARRVAGEKRYSIILNKLNTASNSAIPSLYILLVLLSAPSWILTAIKNPFQRLWLLILDQAYISKYSHNIYLLSKIKNGLLLSE